MTGLSDMMVERVAELKENYLREFFDYIGISDIAMVMDRGRWWIQGTAETFMFDDQPAFTVNHYTPTGITISIHWRNYEWQARKETES